MSIPRAALRPDGLLNVVIETPRGATAKFKFDVDSGGFVLSRELPSGLVYPYDWGFVAATSAPDGDPLDAMVLWQSASYPGVVLPSRIVGVLAVEQRGRSAGRDRNDRLFVVPAKAPRMDHVRTIFDLPERERDELARFFENVVAFENKDVRLLGFHGPGEGHRLLETVIRPAREVEPT